jgi:hypothetical protein
MWWRTSAVFARSNLSHGRTAGHLLSRQPGRPMNPASHSRAIFFLLGEERDEHLAP